MSTQRQDNSDIISSSGVSSTVRAGQSIIDSGNNNQAILSSSLSNEITLNNNTYQIISQIARSGEAELFLVQSNNEKKVFKYYYSQYKPKDEILIKLKGLKHPDIIALLDYGFFQDRFFEISEYAEGGILADIMPLTSLSKTQVIVKEIIEALNYCHNNGIIHRDIKPENIFYKNSDKTDIAIGDFGIASNLKKGEELVKTTLARTSLYAAPELFTNIQGKTTIEKSVDYYALGMTLLHLWVGKNPFEDVDEFGIMRLKSEGRVLFPECIDPDVEKLIKGLITVNPRDRWGYDEVKNWLVGEDVKVLYQTIHLEYKPYSFGLIDGEQIVVNNPTDLAGLLEKYPDKGEGHLYRNTIAKWIENVDQGLFNELMDIVEKEFPKDKKAGLTKAIYILDQDRPFKGADKIKLRTQDEIALQFENNFSHYQNDLKNPNASFYIFLEARNYREKADQYRLFFKNYNSELALNTLILTLQGSDRYILDDLIIFEPNELLKLSENLKVKVIKDLTNTNSKLSIWITRFKNIESTLNKWRILDRYDTTTLRYALNSGFLFNETIANTKEEFYQLFKLNITDFYLAKNKNIKYESNYWLVNYQNISLAGLSIDYLREEQYSDDLFLIIVDYVLQNYQNSNSNIYDTIRIIQKEILNNFEKNEKIKFKLIEFIKASIEKHWIDENKKNIDFSDSLRNFIEFLESMLENNRKVIKELLNALNDAISQGIRNEMSSIKVNEVEFNKKNKVIKTYLKRLKNINGTLPYLKRHEDENCFINHNNIEITKRLFKEKEEKINITYQTYLDLLLKKRQNEKHSTKKEFLLKFVVSFILSLLGFIFLIITIQNSALSINILSWILLILGVAVGIISLVASDNITVGIIVGGVLAWAGYHYGQQMPIQYIYVLCAVVVSVFGIRSILINTKRENLIAGIKLDGIEEKGFNNSLITIDDYFNKKEHFEHFDEQVKVLLFDDDQFNKEYALCKSKIENADANSKSFVLQKTDFTEKLNSINAPNNVSYNILNYSLIGLVILTIALSSWKYLNSKNLYGADNENVTQITKGLIFSVISNGANIRKTPSKNGEIVITAPKGETVEVINTDNSKWFKVRYNGYEGYIYSNLIRNSDNAR